MKFKNWSQSVSFEPSECLEVENDEQIIEIINKAQLKNKKVRVMGSGHSFTPLLKTNDILINTNKMQGLISVDKETKIVKAKAGTKIKALGELLFKNGLAQENLGDINVQSVAGAISTGTHGTGISFGNIPSQISGLTFINGKGEKIYCSETENSEVFKAAQISLGVLGVITEVEIKAQDSYILEFKSGKDTINNVLDSLNELNNTNRNFEFMWFPHTKTVQTRFMNLAQNKTPKNNKLGMWFDDFMENKLYGTLSYPTRYLPQLSKPLSRLSAQFVSTSSKVNWSHNVYSLPRNVLFNEMEYCVPYEEFTKVKKECLQVMSRKKFQIHFPTENRFVKADTIWLSPSFERFSAYIAFHEYKGKPCREYFKAMEEICLAHGGRPHWGKMHTCKATHFEKLYPNWKRFLAIREQMDPDNIFITPYLEQLLLL